MSFNLHMDVMRQLKRLKRGKRIRRGHYQLTFKAQPKAGGKTK